MPEVLRGVQKEMTMEEIHQYVERFAIGAKAAKDAGIDGVEFQAVHEGYLLDLDSQIKCKFRRARKSGPYFIGSAFIENTYIFMEITD